MMAAVEGEFLSILGQSLHIQAVVGFGTVGGFTNVVAPASSALRSSSLRIQWVGQSGVESR